MIAYEKQTIQGSNGIVHPAHPAIIDTVVLADKTKKFSAGTILKFTTDGKTMEAAAVADVSAAVLIEDSDGANAEVLAELHGGVVRSRLIDASGGSNTPAAEGFVAKLRSAGIYALQLFDSAKVV